MRPVAAAPAVGCPRSHLDAPGRVGGGPRAYGPPEGVQDGPGAAWVTPDTTGARIGHSEPSGSIGTPR